MTFRRTIPTEHEEQKAFFEWFRLAYPNVVAFAIPNGGQRNKIVAAKLKAEGVLPGVPDILIADGKPGCFIEMKSTKGSTSKIQEQRIQELSKAGYRVEVCYGWDQAKSVAIEYLGGIK